MTQKELSGLFYLNKETKILQDELIELESNIGTKSVVLSSMPKAKNAKHSIVEDIAIEISDLKTLIQLNLKKIQIERARLERYIGSIEDAEIRLIFRLRHINGMTWYEIGNELYMHHTTVLRKHKAYLKLAQNAQ